MSEKTKKPNRMNELMLKCADNLDNGCDAMNHQFLVDNNVSADECMALSTQLAVAIRAFVRTPKDELPAAIIRGCVDDMDQEARERMVTFVTNDLKMKRTTKRLGELVKKMK